MKKKILFRADGNSEVGLGHLYRLFALVEMVKGTYDFLFISHSSSEISVIPEDYPLIKIPEEIDLTNEPQWLKNCFDTSEYLIVADGYQFVSNYQKKIKIIGFNLIYIDDLVAEYMYADLVINHSPNYKSIIYRGELYTKFALGVNYAMLRPLFLNTARKKRKIKKNIDTVFVCFGGADKFNFSFLTSKVLLQIQQINKIHVVLGAAYDDYQINKLKQKEPNKLQLYKNIGEPKLIQIMESCDFAVVPTSTILFELMCVKMPIISGYFAQNQLMAYEWFNDHDCLFGVGDFREFDFDELKGILIKLNQLSLREKYIENQAQCIDGRQKERFLMLIDAI